MKKPFRPISTVFLLAAFLIPMVPVRADENPNPASPPAPLAGVPATEESAPDNSSARLNLIHVGDKINVDVYREKDLSGIFTVDPKGKINYPLLGEIFVDGLSPEELRAYLTESLGRDYVVNPQIQIDFVESPNKSVSILGSVAKPGNYILTTNSTLVRMISQVGGFSDNASTTNVKVVRSDSAGKNRSQIVDVGRIMSGQDSDFTLLPGDLIYVDRVPEAKSAEVEESQNLVTLLGQVGKPGNYYLTKNMTLIRLIAQAGGFTPVASLHNIRVVRKNKDGKTKTLFVDGGRILSGGVPDFKLESADLVVVQESFF